MIHKIACIADIHFGASSNLTMQLYKNLHDYFIEELKKKQPDIIVIAGDYWHMKLSMTSIEAQCGNNFIKELDKEFPNAYKLIIHGTESHDLNQLDMFNSMCNDKFRIYNNFTVDLIDDMKILIIPEEYFPSKETYNEVLHPVEKYDWVFFHGLFTFAGNYAAKNGNKFNKIAFTTEDFKDNVYGKVTGGHVHDPLVKNNVEYCGSFERWKHGEEMTKGFRYYEYDSSKKKILKSEFIENKGAAKYVTKKYKEFDCDDIDKLIEGLSEASKGMTSLRIKVGRDDEITDTQIQNLVAASMKFDNVILFKESISVYNNKTEEEKLKDEERKNRIKDYSNLSFNQITKKFAKDELNESITDDEIASVLTN